MNSNIIKREKFDHLHLVHHFHAEVSEIKRLFDECFKPQSTHEVVLLLFIKGLLF